MAPIARNVARIVRAAQESYAKKWSFLAVACVIFVSSLTLLARLDLLPDAPRVKADAEAAAAGAVPLAPAQVSLDQPELPVKIAIPKIGLAAAVENASSTEIRVLDGLLLQGAVRYPTSAMLGQENGNVVIFGHSSYLPVVHNSAYKTFDGIQNLKPGDTVTVYSSSSAYTYAVRTVSKEDANSAGIPLTVTGRVLTLATCDSFGEKSSRFVVTAEFVESHTLAS